MAALRAGAARTIDDPTGRPRSSRPRARCSAAPYLNRELSWLDYDARVLHEARDERNPPVERVKFLAIFANMLDEFFQVRVAGLRQQVAAGSTTTSPDGRTPAEQLAEIRIRVQELIEDHAAIFTELRAELAEEGVAILDYGEVPDHHQRLRERFVDEIFPVLTPLAVDPGPPVPVHQHAQPLDRDRHARPGDRRAPLRPGQGAPDPAPPHRDRAADLRPARPGHRGQPRPPVHAAWRSSRRTCSG